MNTLDQFKLEGRKVLITGGAGLLGGKHAEAVIDAKGIPIIVDVNQDRISKAVEKLVAKNNSSVGGYLMDITSKDSIMSVGEKIQQDFGNVDVLINNAAINPKMEDDSSPQWSRFENYSSESWDLELSVGLKGAYLCAQYFGTKMAKNGGGVILNISSDLGVMAPDQRIYRKDGFSDEMQPVKPVTYSVIKHGLIGLTKYLSTYWNGSGVRANTLCPGGVYNNQPDDFVNKLTNLIPMGRMAKADEYKAAVLFLISDASSYMNGSTLTIDGGRTAW